MSVHFGFPPLSLSMVVDQTQPKPTIPTCKLAQLGIPISFYRITSHLNFSLAAIVMYTIAALLLNHINKRRHGKPWAISQTRWFRHTVILHNVLLALYSTWIVFTVVRTLKNAWPRRHDTFYTVLVADLFCQGGQIVPHKETLQELVFVGWAFYISKFYEFIDTAIILAKGRQASLLQIYHHAGVILFGWASVYSEPPPALITLFLNASVHALMYTYYALKSIHVAVPLSVKAAMTTIQIVQFFIDIIVCPCYLFIYYDVPVDYDRCTEHRTMGDSVETPASQGAAVRGESYCDVRTVSCTNQGSHTSETWLGIIFIVSLAWMFLQFFKSTYLQTGKKKTL